MFVLDAMQDDIEELASIMRYLREWRPYWPHDFTEDEVIQTLTALVRDRLVDVYDETSGSSELSAVADPETDEASIRRYWYLPTPQGQELWKAWDAPSLPE